MIINNSLYRRGFSTPWLKCLNKQEAEKVIQEIHEGICGAHAGAHAGAQVVAQKILRTGYFWPTLSSDTREFTKKCEACQRYANTPNLPQ